MADSKKIDMDGSIRLYFDDDRLGLKNVCAEGRHNGSSYRDNEFDFSFARYEHYDSILHAARALAGQGRRFDLHMDVHVDDLFPSKYSYNGRVKFEEGHLMVDFWLPGDKADIVCREGPATTKNVLDAISLVYGGFINACFNYTPDDINLNDPELSAPFVLFNSNPNLHDLVAGLDWGVPVKDLNNMIRQAQATFESISNSKTPTSQREEPDR